MIIIRYYSRIGKELYPRLAKADDFKIEPVEYRENIDNDELPDHIRNKVTRTTYWIFATTFVGGRWEDTAIQEYDTLEEAEEVFTEVMRAIANFQMMYFFDYKGGEQNGGSGDSEEDRPVGESDAADRTPTIIRHDD